MNAPLQRQPQIRFEGREALVSLLWKIQAKFTQKRSWPEYFARTIERYAKANGFVGITFKTERDALEGNSLAQALKAGFADPKAKMNALRLWRENGTSVLFKLTENGELVFPFHLSEVIISMPAYTDFADAVERINQAIKEARELKDVQHPSALPKLLEQEGIQHMLLHPKAAA